VTCVPRGANQKSPNSTKVYLGIRSPSLILLTPRRQFYFNTLKKSSIEIISRWSVPLGGMGWEPDCEQLLFGYFRRSEHPRGARGQTLRCKKNTVKWVKILIPQCLGSSTSRVLATTSVAKQKLLAVRFPTHFIERHTPTTGTFDRNR